MTIIKSFKTAILIALALGLCSRIHAQVNNEILSKLNLYMEKYPEESVYLQTDRSVYSPGETLWFKAWISDDTRNELQIKSHYLFISMIDKDSNEVINHALPFTGNELNGNFLIPSMLNAGYYKLIAYTSWMKNTPSNRIFDKEVFITDERTRNLTVNIHLGDTIIKRGSDIRATINTSRAEFEPVSVPFSYELLNDNNILASGNGKTDKTGKASINLPAPEYKENDALKLIVTASYKNEDFATGIVIPTADNYLNVMFYPEGGALISNVDTKIAFRSYNLADRPVDFSGKIYTSEHQFVKNVSSTYKGSGSFVLRPEKGLTYYLKITHPTGIAKTFNLPVARRSGLALRVEGTTTDTLTMSAEQTGILPNTYYFIGQMKGKVYWMETKRTPGLTTLKVPIADFPSGVAEFTAFDSLKNLLAKRLVYINKNKQLHIAVKPDKQAYAPREEVTLSIEVTDEKGLPVDAELALSVTHSETDTLPDNPGFLTYTSLKSDLIGYLPTPDYYIAENSHSEKTLDNLLIANTFKRFTWRSVFNTTAASFAFSSMEENGMPIPTVGYEKKLAAYFAEDLNSMSHSPGKPYHVFPANNMYAIQNPELSKGTADIDYSRKKDVADIIHSIKPYRVVDNMIHFQGSPISSLSNQGGAGIAIDGVYRGTDPAVLNSLLPMDILRVNVSTELIDIQKYTGLNNVGIIEIFTKSGQSEKSKAKTDQPEKSNVGLNEVFTSPFYGDVTNKSKSEKDQRLTLYWNPKVNVDNSGKAVVRFFNGDIAAPVCIAVEGRSAGSDNHLIGTGTATYTIGK
ncbi:MAG: hypothetical protein JXA72_06760 [Bacteroidales bacterium]|nr:hypothetical protein [Bacteroidales bacterium]